MYHFHQQKFYGKINHEQISLHCELLRYMVQLTMQKYPNILCGDLPSHSARIFLFVQYNISFLSLEYECQTKQHKRIIRSEKREKKKKAKT